MKIPLVTFSLTVALALGAAIPKAENDADSAVNYPASVDMSWVDAKEKSKRADSDEAVVYPASVDMSWVDAKDKAKRVDSDEAVVYPASVDMSWVDAKNKD